MPLKKNKNLKLYYSVGEVAEMFGVNESTLRFWERQFPNISPGKNSFGARQYTQDDIKEIRKVHHLLKERGLTMEGARMNIRQQRGASDDVKTDVIEHLKFIRDELMEIGKALGGLS